MHHIKVDTAGARIDVAVTGFWTVEDVAKFGRDFHAAAAEFALSGRTFVTFYDYSEAIIQSQAVVAAFQAMATATPVRSRRAALFTDGGMARMQARRICSVRPDEMAVFDNRAAALAWLHEDEATPAQRRMAR